MQYTIFISTQGVSTWSQKLKTDAYNQIKLDNIWLREALEIYHKVTIAITVSIINKVNKYIHCIICFEDILLYLQVVGSSKAEMTKLNVLAQ